MKDAHELTLFARRPEAVSQRLKSIDLSDRFAVADFTGFTKEKNFDAIINFVGVGDPVQVAVMGASIFDVTLK